MSPVPLRGTSCSPENVVFTAAKLMDVRGVDEEGSTDFLDAIFGNAFRFFGMDPFQPS